MSYPVKNPARFVGCQSGFGQIIAIRFRPRFPFRSYTGYSMERVRRGTVLHIFANVVGSPSHKGIARRALPASGGKDAVGEI